MAVDDGLQREREERADRDQVYGDVARLDAVDDEHEGRHREHEPERERGKFAPARREQGERQQQPQHAELRADVQDLGDQRHLGAREAAIARPVGRDADAQPLERGDGQR